eukprot:TRINITY_DN2796_c0_g3_i1.p3 TRINITY_DN2796_c0_g3~~TRINITY_DN2796_c0_g3_i1.p3  ORF type:complete len:141 (-),score=0.80 TRINITY_DN2796_c0_g3_i1:782-1204(-)
MDFVQIVILQVLAHGGFNLSVITHLAHLENAIFILVKNNCSLCNVIRVMQMINRKNLIVHMWEEQPHGLRNGWGNYSMYATKGRKSQQKISQQLLEDLNLSSVGFRSTYWNGFVKMQTTSCPQSMLFMQEVRELRWEKVA